MSAQKIAPADLVFPPNDPDKLLGWLNDLVKQLQDLFNNLQSTVNALCVGNLATIQMEKQYAAPKGVKDGWIAFADGTTWNPGSGQGFYGYYGGAWHFLG